MAVPTPTAPAFLAATGAIFSSFHALGLDVTNKQMEKFYLHPFCFSFILLLRIFYEYNFEISLFIEQDIILKLVCLLNKI